MLVLINGSEVTVVPRAPEERPAPQLVIIQGSVYDALDKRLIEPPRPPRP